MYKIYLTDMEKFHFEILKKQNKIKLYIKTIFLRASDQPLHYTVHYSQHIICYKLSLHRMGYND